MYDCLIGFFLYKKSYLGGIRLLIMFYIIGGSVVGGSGFRKKFK